MRKDRIWKNVLEKFFISFTEFFLPELHKNIDFSKPIKFLDNELSKITQKSEGKNRASDKLVEVSLNDGTNRWVLVHIEVQDARKTDFAFRMFQYYYRIFDKFNKKIVAISIYTDDNGKFKPSEYNDTFFGTEINYKFNIYKVLDQKNNIVKLKESTNPFSLVILASLYFLESKKDENKRYNFKIELVKLLFKKGYTNQEIKELFDFIDILVKFKSEQLEIKYLEEVDKMAKTKEKPLIGSYNKMLIDRGSKNRDIEIILNGKKEGLSNEMLSKLTKLSIEEVENILKKKK